MKYYQYGRTKLNKRHFEPNPNRDLERADSCAETDAFVVDADLEHFISESKILTLSAEI